MTEEGGIQREIMLSAPVNVRLFRNNTGTGWVGKVAKRVANSLLILSNPRPLNAGLCKGSSDLIGWTEKIITPDMVGQKIAIFTAIEAKTGKGKISEDQENFIKKVTMSGGIAFVARDPGDLKGKF